MLDIRPRYSLRKFPVFIDPVVTCLEVELQVDEGQPHWRQLGRLQPKPSSFSFTLDSRMVHFFGPEPDLADCPFLLVYDPAGVLRFRFGRSQDGFDQYEIAEEMNGRTVTAPSVRVVFRSAEAAQRFAATIDALVTDKAGPDEAAEWLAAAGREVSAVRILPVVPL